MRKFKTQIQEHVYNLLIDTLNKDQVKLLNSLLDMEHSNGIDSFVRSLRKGNTITKHDIYTSDKERGKEYINLLVGDKQIVKIKESKEEFVIECIYDIYRTVKPTENARGNKCHYVHIDKEVLENNSDLVKMIERTAIRGKVELGENGNYVRYF